MQATRRYFPRIPFVMKIAYETVKWNENNLNAMERPQFTESYNLSVSGIGLSGMPELDKHIHNKLITGKLKIRLALYIQGDDDPDPIRLFARLVWISEHDAGATACGFSFIDISNEKFSLIESFVNDRMAVDA